MNDLTKKIFISGSLIFSICALGTGLLLIKNQSRLAAQFDAFHKTNHHLKSTVHTPIAPTELRNTWLDVQKKVKDTVVQVFAHVSEFNLLEPYKTPEQREGAGSGFFCKR